jgi:hypothetical protein
MQTADDDTGKVTPVNNLTEFFRDALGRALASQHVSLDEHTTHYVVNLLTLYARTEISHGDTRPGQRWVSLGRRPRHPSPSAPRRARRGAGRSARSAPPAG